MFLSITSFFLFCCGVYHIFWYMEPNLCQMTYMFEHPQYTRINFKGNNNFTNYGLYYYSEGRGQVDLQRLNGAPVLFVPGNGGSYKQARSFASVALRMGMGFNKPHFDYFTIDYDEELSALYGGYLEKQKAYMELCIKTILGLYRNRDPKLETKMVIIGHSMGGVIAKSILGKNELEEKVEVMIFIATPMDRPVVYIDSEMDKFYKRSEKAIINTQNDTENSVTKIGNILLISVGGGSRDLLVPAAYTTSQFSDIHAMTTSIPNVWLSCDHLSAVWCLQFVKVVNKFLYDLTYRVKEGYTLLSTDTESNLRIAYNYFVGYTPNREVKQTAFELEDEVLSSTEVKLNYTKSFPHGLRQNHEHFIDLRQLKDYEQLYISVTHEIGNQWLYACQQRNCLKHTVLMETIEQLPSKKGQKSFTLLNLINIAENYADWTHLMIHLPATKHYAAFAYDVHNFEERTLNVIAPQWFEFRPKNIITATDDGAIYHQLLIYDLRESFYTFELQFKHGECERQEFESVVKINIPTGSGFDRYYTLTESDENKAILLKLHKTHEYNLNNVAENFVLNVELHLEPTCSFVVKKRFALMATMRHLVQQHYYELPAHMAAFLITSISNNQLQRPTDAKSNFMQKNKSWIIVLSVCLAGEVLQLLSELKFMYLEYVNFFSQSFYVAVVLHGTAIICCHALLYIVKMFLKLSTFVYRKMIEKNWNFSLPKANYIFGTVGVLCSIFCADGLSLLLMFIFYIVLITRAFPAQLPKAMQDARARHLSLALLLLVLGAINVGGTIAWFKSPKIIAATLVRSPLKSVNFLLATVIIVFRHLKVPTPREPFNRKFAMFLCASAAVCLILCQDKIYRLNYVITFVFVLIFSNELFDKKTN